MELEKKLNEEFIASELNYYKDNDYLTREEKWDDIARARDVQLIKISNAAFRSKTQAMMKSRGSYMIYYSSNIDRMWIKEYGRVLKIHYTQRS